MVGKSSSSFITEPAPLGLQTLVHAQTISAARVHLSVPKVVAQLKATAPPPSLQKAASSTPLQGEGLQGSSSSTSYRPTVVAYNTTSQSSTDAMRSRLVCSPQPASASASASVPSARQHSAWTKYFTHSVMTVAASDHVTAASLGDGSLHWFDTMSGVRLAPPIVCEAHLAHLRCQDRFCLALDCVGQLSVWDTDAMEATVDRVSIAPLLYSAQLSTTASAESKPKAAESSSTAEDEKNDGEPENASGDGNDEKVRAPRRHRPMVALTAVDILPAGNGGGGSCTPVLCLSDGRVYTYHTRLRSWIRIGDPAEYVGSDYYICPPVPTTSTATPDTTSASRLRARATTGSTLEFLQERAYYQRNLTDQVNNNNNKDSNISNKRLFSSTSSSLDDQKPVKYAVTLDHLESQLRGADTVGSDDEVIRYADLLARQLARSADNTARVSRWLAELLGPPMAKGMLPAAASAGITCSWSPTIGASVPKRQILERILPLLATNRHFQDLVDEYSGALKQVIQQ
ncbi:Protein hir2 [Coemansia sp. RSA 1285]|nr:Protein hir2 [Coemansia sp. RSA 1285]